MTSSTSPYLSLRPLRPLLFILLPFASFLASALSISAQTTLSYGPQSPNSSSDQPLAAGFLTNQSMILYGIMMRAEAGLVLSLVISVFLSTLARIVYSKRMPPELEEPKEVLVMWLMAAVLFLVEISLVFRHGSETQLNLRRAMLLLVYVILGGAVVRR